ncbi:MAG: hypothetical protein CMJ19_00240 [Phycisphaeraceae bacterium]|nr:hypothetical protein [Phycisphaeraceae bacterium]
MSTPLYLPPVPQLGRIDIHSHLLPRIDDGCEDVNQCIDCIRQLKEAGYTGSICTPHIIPNMFPDNTRENIIRWVENLRIELVNRNIEYTLWPGGEINLQENMPDWLTEHGVPTLAGSNCVLMDHWADIWPDWFPTVIQWFLDQGYQPILAHPERMRCCWDQPDGLDQLLDMGVWLQGNFLPITGEEGYEPDQLSRRYIENQKYKLMAMDMHKPQSIPSRFDGMKIVLTEYGNQLLDHFTVDAPRQLILSHLL